MISMDHPCTCHVLLTDSVLAVLPVYCFRYVVGLATSPDGFKWTKQGVVFDPATQVSPMTALSSLWIQAAGVYIEFMRFALRHAAR